VNERLVGHGRNDTRAPARRGALCCARLCDGVTARAARGARRPGGRGRAGGVDKRGAMGQKRASEESAVR
jgi:hypothetical protein